MGVNDEEVGDGEAEETMGLDTVFVEPPRPPSPEPTFSTYTREKGNSSHDWSKVELRLVGFHPLWGQHLWNAAVALASYLDRNEELYVNKGVLELGAGSGLPGIVTALNGARRVVLTDYPDQPLLDNLSYNVLKNVPEALQGKVLVHGYIWGRPVGDLLPSSTNASPDGYFDLVIMSDLVFNHSQHNALLNTCEKVLRPANSCVLVFFTHHRPHLMDRDMKFFDLAQMRGFRCEKVLTQTFPPMFPEDPGDEEVRSTVHGWRLTWDGSPSN